MNKLKTWWGNFMSPTPLKKKRIRNIAVAALFIAGAISRGALGNPPDWFTQSIWYISSVLIAVIAWAQSYKEQEDDK
jgi:hypothetical protein